MSLYSLYSILFLGFIAVVFIGFIDKFFYYSVVREKLLKKIDLSCQRSGASGT